MKSDRRSPDTAGIYSARHERITEKIGARLAKTEGEVTVGSVAAWVGTSPYYALGALRRLAGDDRAEATRPDESMWRRVDESSGGGS